MLKKMYIQLDVINKHEFWTLICGG